MININVVKKVGIPVKIGELEFDIDMSDERLEELATKHEEIVVMFSGIGDSSKEAKKALKKGFNLFLGKGSFKKIYEQTPSLIGCANILVELLELLPKAIKGTMTQQEKALKLTKNKK